MHNTSPDSPPPVTESPQTPLVATPGPLTRVWDAIRRRWWSRWLFNLLVIAGVLFAITAFQTRHLLESGRPAPGFTLRSIDGKLVRLSDYRGKKVVLEFWSPWCAVCKVQAGALSALSKDPEVRVISIVLGYRNLDEVRKFISAHGVTFPVLLGDEQVARKFRIQSFPTLYVLNERGQIAHALIGYTTEWGLRFRLHF